MQKHVSYPLARVLYESGVRLETEHCYLQSETGEREGWEPSFIKHTRTSEDDKVKHWTFAAADLPEILAALPSGYSDENYENDYELTLRKDPVANQYVFRYENGISLVMADIAVAHEAAVESAGLLLLELKKRDLV